MVTSGIISGIAVALISAIILTYNAKIKKLEKSCNYYEEKAQKRGDLISLDRIFYEECNWADKTIFAGCDPTEPGLGVRLFRLNGDVLEELSMREGCPKWYDSDVELRHRDRLRYIELPDLEAYWAYLKEQRLRLNTAFNRIAVDKPDIWRVFPQKVTELAPTNLGMVQRAWVSDYLLRTGWTTDDGVTFRIQRDGRSTMEVYLRGKNMMSREDRLIGSTGTRCDNMLHLLLQEVAYLEKRSACDVLLDIIKVPGENRHIESIALEKEQTKVNTKEFTVLSHRGDLQKAVIGVFENNPERAWTTGEIAQELQRLKLQILAKKPGLAVNTVCRRLLTKGLIERVSPAYGRCSATYQWINWEAVS